MKFIICAPRYEATSGGSIVLHKLAAILSDIGHEALLWPLHKVWVSASPFSRHWWQKYTYAATRIYRPHYAGRPGTEVKFARESDISNSIVIYPEILHANPLGAQRYLRWILYKQHIDTTSVEPGDLYFCYQDAFNNQHNESKYGGILNVCDFMLDIYRKTNLSSRHGTCYMIRKGRARNDLPSFHGKLVLDGMNHQRIANIFNRTQYCYFYDLYTIYSTYAAICGCIPIVVPMPGVTNETWEPNGGKKPGIAYGESDISYAIASRQILLQQVANAEANSIKSVERFVSIVRTHFN